MNSDNCPKQAFSNTVFLSFIIGGILANVLMVYSIYKMKIGTHLPIAVRTPGLDLLIIFVLISVMVVVAISTEKEFWRHDCPLRRFGVLHVCQYFRSITILCIGVIFCIFFLGPHLFRNPYASALNKLLKITGVEDIQEIQLNEYSGKNWRVISEWKILKSSSSAEYIVSVSPTYNVILRTLK